MAKVYATGFEFGFAPAQGATGWTAATSSSITYVTNPRFGVVPAMTPGLALQGTLTLTGPATSGIRGCGTWAYVQSTQADIVTFGSVILRINSNNTFVIRNNGVDGTPVTLSPIPSTGAYIPVEWSIDLGLSATGNVTFKVNGQTATSLLITTVGATATTLTLVSGGNGVTVGAIDDLFVNDNTGAVDNGIPALGLFVKATAVATGTNNAMAISGLRSIKADMSEVLNTSQFNPSDATYSTVVGAFISLPDRYPQNSSGVPIILSNRLRQTTQANVKTYVALDSTIYPTMVGSGGVGTSLCHIFNDSTGLLYNGSASSSGSSTVQYCTINPTTGAVSLGPGGNIILGNVVKVGSFLYYSQQTALSNSPTAVRSDLSFNSRSTLSGVGASAYNQIFYHYSSVADRIYCNAGGTSTTDGFGSLANGGTTFTAIPVTAFGAVFTDCFGWLEDAANSRLYFFGKGISNTNTTCFVFNTSNNTFVRQINLGVQLVAAGTFQGVSATRNDAQCLRNIVGNFAASKIYFASQAGVIYQLDLATDVVTTITTVTVLSNISRDMPLLGIFGTTLYVFGFDKVTFINTANNAVLGSAGYPNKCTNSTFPSYRIYTDGTYYFVPQEHNWIFFNPGTNTFEVATSKTQVSDNFLHAFNNDTSGTQVSSLQGNPTTAIQQSFTLSLPVTPTRIAAMNVSAPSTFKSGALSASLQLGLKSAGVDYQAGTNQVPPTSPIANIAQPLYYKTGTTEFTPAELASAEVYAKIV